MNSDNKRLVFAVVAGLVWFLFLYQNASRAAGAVEMSEHQQPDTSHRGRMREIERLTSHRDLLRRALRAKGIAPSLGTPQPPTRASYETDKKALAERAVSLKARLDECERLLALDGSGDPSPPPAKPEQLATQNSAKPRHHQPHGSNAGRSTCRTHRTIDPVAAAEVGIDRELMSEVDPPSTIAVVIIAYNRVHELHHTISQVLSILPSKGFRLFVSQDGANFADVTATIQRFSAKCDVVHLIHAQNSSGGTPEEIANGWEPYLAISHHYGFIMEQSSRRRPTTVSSSSKTT